LDTRASASSEILECTPERTTTAAAAATKSIAYGRMIRVTALAAIRLNRATSMKPELGLSSDESHVDPRNVSASRIDSTPRRRDFRVDSSRTLKRKKMAPTSSNAAGTKPETDEPSRFVTPSRVH